MTAINRSPITHHECAPHNRTIGAFQRDGFVVVRGFTKPRRSSHQRGIHAIVGLVIGQGLTIEHRLLRRKF